MNCPNKTKNLKSCNCTYDCDLKGYCCECLANHRARKQLPACYFPDFAEKTYDRSVEYFARLKAEGKTR